jgi:hypothetical protein
MFERDLVGLIELQSDITFYPLILPTQVQPSGAGVYRIVNDSRHAGGTYGDFTFRSRTVRFTILDSSYLNLINVSEKIKSLDGYAGTINKTEFRSLRITNVIDSFNSAQNVYERMIEISVSSVTDADQEYPPKEDQVKTLFINKLN